MEQGADYEEALETAIPLRDNQAYGHVDLKRKNSNLVKVFSVLKNQLCAIELNMMHGIRCGRTVLAIIIFS